MSFLMKPKSFLAQIDSKGTTDATWTLTSNEVLTFVFINYSKSVIGVCIFALSLFLCVPDRLMAIICAHPPVCAIDALIGACALASSTKMSERARRSRETSRRLRLFRSPSPWALIALLLSCHNYSWIEDFFNYSFLGNVGWRIPIRFLLFND